MKNIEKEKDAQSPACIVAVVIGLLVGYLLSEFVMCVRSIKLQCSIVHCWPDKVKNLFTLITFSSHRPYK